MQVPSNNFFWLNEEIEAIGTKKFFVPAGKTSGDTLDEFEKQYGKLPVGYKDFVAQFGGVHLFRHCEREEYALVIERSPKLVKAQDNGFFISIGSRVGNQVYLFGQNGAFVDEILEHRESGGIVSCRDGFAAWLRRSFEKEKRSYSKAEWDQISDGPPPFSAQERGTIEARLKWDVSLAGYDAKNNLILQVQNNSERIFKYITVNIRRGWIRALVPVRVEHISPRASASCTIAFYKDSIRTGEAEVLPIFDIGPEDRKLLFELEGPEWFRKRSSKGLPMGTEKL